MIQQRSKVLKTQAMLRSKRFSPSQMNSFELQITNKQFLRILNLAVCRQSKFITYITLYVPCHLIQSVERGIVPTFQCK